MFVSSMQCSFLCSRYCLRILTVCNFCVREKTEEELNAQDSAIITNNKDTLIIVPLVSYAVVT